MKKIAIVLFLIFAGWVLAILFQWTTNFTLHHTTVGPATQTDITLQMQPYRELPSTFDLFKDAHP